MNSIKDLLRAAMSGERLLARPDHAAEYENFLKRQREAHTAIQAELWPEHVRQCGAHGRTVEAFAKGIDPEEPATVFAERWLKSDKNFLVLSGHTGVGKTVSACLVFRRAVRLATRLQEPLPEWDGWNGAFVMFSQLRRLSDFHEDDRALLAKAKRVRALVLDDVGGAPGEVMPPRLREVFEELIDFRDSEGKWTAITTNLGLKSGEDGRSDFGRFVGDRVLSRLSRGMMAKECGVKDLRRRSA